MIAGRWRHERGQTAPATGEHRQAQCGGYDEQQHCLKPAPGPQQAAGQHDAQRLGGDGNAEGQVDLGNEAQYRQQGGKEGDLRDVLRTLARQGSVHE